MTYRVQADTSLFRLLQECIFNIRLSPLFRGFVQRKCRSMFRCRRRPRGCLVLRPEPQAVQPVEPPVRLNHVRRDLRESTQQTPCLQCLQEFRCDRALPPDVGQNVRVTFVRGDTGSQVTSNQVG